MMLKRFARIASSAVAMWWIGKPDAIITNSKLSVTHAIGIGPSDMEVVLYDSDCSNEITANWVRILDVDYNNKTNSLTYDLQITKNQLTTSNDLLVFDADTNKQKGNLFFCIKANAIRATEHASWVVQDRNTNFQVTFDKGKNKFLTDVFIDAEVDITTNGIINTDNYSVIACQCNRHSFDCIVNPEAKPQNALVSICVKPNSPDISIAYFEMELSLDDGSYTYSPVTINNNSPEPHELSELDSDTESGSFAVTFRLFAGFYESDNSNAIVVSGTAWTEFATSKGVSDVALQYDTLIDITQKVSNEDDTGCLGNLLRGIQKLLN